MWSISETLTQLEVVHGLELYKGDELMNDFHYRWQHGRRPLQGGGDRDARAD